MATVLSATDLQRAELLDTSDVAHRLGLSASRVVQLEREGRIAAARTASGRRVFLAADVAAFLEARGVSRAG